MRPNEKQCPKCAETILAEAVKCKHCGSNIGPKRRIWPWVVGIPLSILIFLFVVGINVPEEKHRAREAINACWKMAEDRLLSPIALEACRSMVADFERKYGPAPSLRRY